MGVQEQGERARRRNLVLLGVLLLLGFLLPSHGDRVGYVFVGKILEEAAETVGSGFILYPVVAGIVVILASFFSRPARGSAVVLAGLLYVVIYLGAHEHIHSQGDISTAFLAFSVHAWAAAIYVVTLALVLAGNRATRYAPGSRLAWSVAGIGAVLFAVCMLLPTGGREDRTFVAAVVDLLGVEHQALRTLGVILLGGLLLQASGALIGLLNRRGSGRLANAAFWLTLGGVVVFVFGGYARWLFEIESETQGRTAVFPMLKWGGLGLGLTLILPAGLTDLLVGHPNAESESG